MVVDPDRLPVILERVGERIMQANEDGDLLDVLAGLGLQGLINADDDFDSGACDKRYGDILVLGRCQARKSVLQAVGREMGYDVGRFKFVEYTDVGKFDVANIRYSESYAAVMCGPVPHMAIGIGEATSLLEELRHEGNGYPPLAELRAGGGEGELCINKQTFRTGLAALERAGKIKPSNQR